MTSVRQRAHPRCLRQLHHPWLGMGGCSWTPLSCFHTCKLPLSTLHPSATTSPLTQLLQLVWALGFNHNHTQVVAEDDPPILSAAALGLAQSLVQPPPQSRGGRAQKVFCPRQEIHHEASNRVTLDKALGDIPARRELMNAVHNTQSLQNIRDAVGGDVVAAVGGRQAVSVLLP